MKVLLPNPTIPEKLEKHAKYRQWANVYQKINKNGPQDGKRI